jgi:GNAT superfamily N-acetyltransferase
MFAAMVPCPTFEVPHGGADYLELVRLRDLYLRQPLGLCLHDEDLSDEAWQRHFAIKQAGSIVGGLIALRLSADSVKLRQMWILPELRGQGNGKQLLATVEQALLQDGVRHFTLHARRDATGFYRKCGYDPVGTLFTEIGLPHQRMDKFA